MSARRTARRVRNLVEQLEQLEQLGAAIGLVEHQRAKDRRDRAAGVIDTVEVQPGVYAVPQRRIAAAHSTLGAKLLELEDEARSVLGAFDQLRATLRGSRWPR